MMMKSDNLPASSNSLTLCLIYLIFLYIFSCCLNTVRTLSSYFNSFNLALCSYLHRSR